MCPECGQPAHLPEECPAAVTYSNGGTGACEHWFLQHDREGMALAILRDNGTITETEYYEQLVEGIHYLHAAGACGL